MGIKSAELAHGCFSRAADDEPLFVLRAQDKHAPVIVEKWADEAAMTGASLKKVEHAKQLAQDMRDWALVNGSKYPD